MESPQKAKTAANVVIALALAVISLPPIPVFKGWDSTHLATVVLALAGGAGYLNTPKQGPAKPTEEGTPQ